MLLAGSAIEPDTASAFEVAVFRAFNDAPDFLYPVVWPLMQYGTFITIPIATLVALLFHKLRLAVEMAAAGVAVYGLAKLAKDAFPGAGPGLCSSTPISVASPPVNRDSRPAMRPSRRRSRSSCSHTCPDAGGGRRSHSPSSCRRAACTSVRTSPWTWWAGRASGSRPERSRRSSAGFPSVARPAVIRTTRMT